MSKFVRAAFRVSLFATAASSASQALAAAALTYGITALPAVEGSAATGVDNKGNVLTTNLSKKKAKDLSQFCKFEQPECDRMVVRSGGSGHPGRYNFLSLDTLRIAAVGQVHVKGDWYATYKSRLWGRHDEIITPGTAYGVAPKVSLVVGETANGEAFSYALVSSKLSILPTLGGATGSARAVNALGTIVGDSTNALGLRRATRWEGGVPHDMGVLPDGQHSTARALNDAGVAVGCADKGPELRRVAVKFENEVVVELGTLGEENGNEACATVIATNGFIAGWSTVLPGEGTHAFIMEDDAIVDLNDRISEGDRAVYELSSVGGTNASGQLAVTARRRADAVTVPLLLTPLP
jgi:uncharacterized membrane protein